MKWTIYLTTICATFLLTGCSQKSPPVLDEPPVLFCDVEEPRRFTQAELDWRAANAPWNLRRDFKTNKTWDREGCEKTVPLEATIRQSAPNTSQEIS